MPHVNEGTMVWLLIHLFNVPTKVLWLINLIMVSIFWCNMLTSKSWLSIFAPRVKRMVEKKRCELKYPESRGFPVQKIEPVGEFTYERLVKECKRMGVKTLL